MQCRISPCIFSDHDIVHLTINIDAVERGPGIWMLNSSLLNDVNYISLIETFWLSRSNKKHNFSTLSDWWEMGKHHIKHLTIEFSKAKTRSSCNIKELEQRLSTLKLQEMT